LNVDIAHHPKQELVKVCSSKEGKVQCR